MENRHLEASLPFAVPGRRERVAAGAVASIAVALAASVVPFAHDGAPPSAGLVAIVYTTLMLAAVAIAWMLAALYRLSASEPLVVLATVYGYAAVIIALYMAAFPGVVVPHGAFAGSATAATFWCVAHAGFIALVLVYAWAERIAGRPGRTSPRARAFVRTVVTCVVAPLGGALCMTILAQRTWAISPDGRFAPAFAFVAAPALALGYLVVIAAVVRATRLSTTTSLWIAVVLVGLECEVWTGGILAGSYYSVSWYVSCLEGFVAGGAFFNIIARMVGTALTELANNNKVLADRSVRDSLTNLLNRRGFDDCLAGISQDQRRRRISAVSLLIVDIDRFKSINDAHGHVEGDRVLRDVADAISGACARARDACYRIGGEEFAVVLASTDRAGAAVVAERIRRGVSAVRVPGDGDAGAERAITVSIGAASMDPLPNLDTVELYRRADVALFEAKGAGRNRVVAYESIRQIA